MCTLNILIHILLISGSFAPGTSFVNAIHAPANGATEDQHQATEVHPISIHALTNGATAIKNLQMTLSTNFNPRSGERSDFNYGYAYTDDVISIHAPANGATCGFFKSSTSLSISIHAPANGATSHDNTGFHRHDISIHAPANGATVQTHYTLDDIIFQSTLRQTERLSVREYDAVSFEFQSTLRRTERHSCEWTYFHIVLFQSTLRRTERPRLTSG